MRYTHLFNEAPSPSDAGLITITNTKAGKTKPALAPLIIPGGQQQHLTRTTQPQSQPQPRLPNSQRHLIRKASISTGEGSSLTSSLENRGGGGAGGRRHPSEAKKLKAMPEQVDDMVVQMASPRERRAANKIGLKLPSSATFPKLAHLEQQQQQQPPTPKTPRLRAWEGYLHWLCLTEEPGTLWVSSLCATFHEALVMPTTTPPPSSSSSDQGSPDPDSPVTTAATAEMTAKAAECAARVDDIYWSFYLPLDPLMQFMEDRILSGYLLHVWTMFVELGKRIPHDDPAQDKLVELLRELVHLPPMEVRTWEGNNAPWSDLPTLDDALISGWDDLYDPEIQMTDPETYWVNYFSFLGRLVTAGVTPDWWEIPAVTLQDVLVEEITPTYLTRYKTMALAEFMNHAGDAFFDWAIDSGLLDVDKDMSMILPLMESPVEKDWFEHR